MSHYHLQIDYSWVEEAFRDFTPNLTDKDHWYWTWNFREDSTHLHPLPQYWQEQGISSTKNRCKVPWHSIQPLDSSCIKQFANYITSAVSSAKEYKFAILLSSWPFVYWCNLLVSLIYQQATIYSWIDGRPEHLTYFNFSFDLIPNSN